MVNNLNLFQLYSFQYRSNVVYIKFYFLLATKTLYKEMDLINYSNLKI